MKKFFFTVAIVAAALGSHAQKSKIAVSIGPELGFTTGNFSNTHSFGIGGNITAEYMVDQSMSITGASGILVYSGKSAGSSLKFKSATIIPIRAGARYYMAKSIFGAGELGLGIVNTGTSTTAFGYSIGLGTKFGAKNKNIEAVVKYDAYSKSGTLGAIVFKAALIL